MIDQNWNHSFNYQMIQSVNVLKDMIDVRDYVKECAILNMDDVMYSNILSDIWNIPMIFISLYSYVSNIRFSLLSFI